MTTTTYYNLNIVEGTDIVNPLTVDNPNYEKIDETMHDNAVSGVTMATEIANATVHAITRENSECAVIRFIATSVWKAGDTATVDGVPVTVLLPSGETLPDGAYVINANVLCILTGTNLTVYAERKKTDNAIDIAYHGTNVSTELDKINSNLNNKSNKWTKLYSGNTLMNTGTSVNLTDMIANYTEIRFVYRYPETGYFYTRDFFNTGNTTYWVIEATLTDATKIFSLFNRQENQGNKLTCVQSGSVSGVYLYEVWVR